MSDEYKLSPKYKDFLKHNAPVEFLEGTTAAGKTTVGITKFMLKVAKSKKKMHVIAAKTTGVAEKNIIQKEYGIIDVFGDLVKYNGNGDKDNKIPHIRYNTPNGDKVIYILGYDNVDKWKMALGSQFGCVLIDEINTASIDFVREICTRNDYLMATLNPDDPNLPIYSEFINCSRPLEKYKKDVPVEILEQLNSEEKPNWTYWFFSFYDNASLSEEDIEKKKLSAPKGTKLYKNKILGLRGRATGLIFSNFERKNNVISKEKAKTYKFIQFSAGLDTAYSESSPDTLAMTFIGITDKGKLCLLYTSSINVVINDCIKWGLFDSNLLETKKILTSKGVQARYLEAVGRRTKVEIRKEYLLLDENIVNAHKNLVIVDINFNNEEVSDNINPKSKVKKCKVKKSKVNNNKEDSCSGDFNIYKYMQQRGFVAISSIISEQIQACLLYTSRCV